MTKISPFVVVDPPGMPTQALPHPSSVNRRVTLVPGPLQEFPHPFSASEDVSFYPEGRADLEEGEEFSVIPGRRRGYNSIQDRTRLARSRHGLAREILCSRLDPVVLAPSRTHGGPKYSPYTPTRAGALE